MLRTSIALLVFTQDFIIFVRFMGIGPIPYFISVVFLRRRQVVEILSLLPLSSIKDQTRLKSKQRYTFQSFDRIASSTSLDILSFFFIDDRRFAASLNIWKPWMSPFLILASSCQQKKYFIESRVKRTNTILKNLRFSTWMWKMQRRMLAIGSQLSSGDIDRFDLKTWFYYVKMKLYRCRHNEIRSEEHLSQFYMHTKDKYSQHHWKGYNNRSKASNFPIKTVYKG